MKREPGNLSRSVVRTASLAVTLFHFVPTIAAAEEPPEEEVAAEGEAAAGEATAQETIDGLVAAPGGVPAEPMDASSAVDTVKAAMANVRKDEAGIGNTYTIKFGDTFDWVQMSSGEWIKGNIERMRDDTMEFDSDDLDMLYLDFDDVVIVHSPQVNTYVFDDRISATGKAVITEDLVIVQTADEGTKTFPRSELESIVEGEREKDWWSMKLRFGLTLNRGNTDQLTYDINFNVKREDRLTLLDLNYNSTFGQTNGEQNVNRHLGEALFQVFLGSRWWVTPAFGQLLNDRFANTKFRATPAAGAGVHIIDVDNVTWDFQTGVGYQFLRYENAEAGTENPQHDAFIPLFTYWDFDITGDIDLTLSWLTNLVVTTIGNTNHTGKADLAIELTSVLDLDIAFLFLRTEKPAQPVQPPPPEPPLPLVEKNDYQLIVGISLELG
jgi:putative salt-induced outer membrane protein YdiY